MLALGRSAVICLTDREFSCKARFKPRSLHNRGPEKACYLAWKRRDARHDLATSDAGLVSCNSLLGRCVFDPDSEVGAVPAISETLANSHGRGVRSEGLVKRELSGGYGALDYPAHHRCAEAAPSLIRT